MGWFGVLLIVLSFLFGHKVGYQNGHNTVAKECEKLGSFYVGDKTYICTDIKTKEE